MRGLFLLAAGILAAASAAGEPVERATPLFDAVKTFCFDAGARYEGVKVAVEAAGGKNIEDEPDAQSWQLSGWAKNRDFKISIFKLDGDVRSARYPMCAVSSEHNEDASVEALKAWAAGRPDIVRAEGQTSYHYLFQTVDGVPKPTYGARAHLKAVNEDRCWYLGIYRFEISVEAVLARCDREPADPDVVRQYSPIRMTEYNTTTDTLFLLTGLEPPLQFGGKPERKSKQIAPDVTAEMDENGEVYGYTIRNASKNPEAIGKLMLAWAKKK